MSAHPNMFRPTDRVLRQFSGIWIVFFGAIAALQMYRHRPVLAMVLGALAVTLGPIGLLWPRAMKPIFVGWMVLVFPIGWTVSRVILGILFYGLFTPIAWIFRMIGRDALGLKPKAQAATCWSAKPGAADKSRYLRQS
jgi:hypothetical protein